MRSADADEAGRNVHSAKLRTVFAKRSNTPAALRGLLVVAVVLGVCGATVFAATLTNAATKAYGDYLDRARRSFLDRVKQPVGDDATARAALHREETIVRPGGGDGIR